MKNDLILDYKLDKNGLRFLVKSEYIEKLIQKKSTGIKKLFNRACYAINENNLGITSYASLYAQFQNKLTYNDMPNLLFLKSVGLSRGIQIVIEGIFLDEEIKDYINKVRLHLPDIIKEIEK